MNENYIAYFPKIVNDMLGRYSFPEKKGKKNLNLN